MQPLFKKYTLYNYIYMDIAYQNRFIKLKRYEDSLRKSMENFNKISQQTNFNIFFQNPASYQFKHLQLQKKNSYKMSLNKKTSFNHFNIVAAHTKKISQLNYKDFTNELKTIRKNRPEKSSDHQIKLRKKQCLSPDISKFLRIHNLRTEIRPKTVSPEHRRKEVIIEAKKAKDDQMFSNKSNELKHKSMDDDISPWKIV